MSTDLPVECCKCKRHVSCFSEIFYPWWDSYEDMPCCDKDCLERIIEEYGFEYDDDLAYLRDRKADKTINSKDLVILKEWEENYKEWRKNG